MKPLKSTGEVAKLCQTTEPKVAHLVRSGRIDPPPLVVAGRRFWTAEQARQAADALGALDAAAHKLIDVAFGVVRP